jgi:hypothetical protein
LDDTHSPLERCGASIPPGDRWNHRCRSASRADAASRRDRASARRRTRRPTAAARASAFPSWCDGRRPTPGNVWRADRFDRAPRGNVGAQARRAQGPWLIGASSEVLRVWNASACVSLHPVRESATREQGEGRRRPVRRAAPRGGRAWQVFPGAPGPPNGSRFGMVQSRPGPSGARRRLGHTHGGRVLPQPHRAGAGFGPGHADAFGPARRCGVRRRTGSPPCVRRGR